MKILYKLTTRSRPAKMFAAIENIRAMSTTPDPWIIVTLDTDDASCNNSVVRVALDSFPNVYPIFGKSYSKIHAINRDIPTGWDVIVATSDDVEFLVNMNELIVADCMAAYKKQIGAHSSIKIDPENFDFTLWYNDGFPHGKIMTVPIMTYKYYKRLGYIYHPMYTSLFCDEESIAVGEKLGKIFYSEANILKHMHPAWGMAETDAQYKFTESFYGRDKLVFDSRKANGFPL